MSRHYSTLIVGCIMVVIFQWIGNRRLLETYFQSDVSRSLQRSKTSNYNNNNNNNNNNNLQQSHYMRSTIARNHHDIETGAVRQLQQQQQQQQQQQKNDSIQPKKKDDDRDYTNVNNNKNSMNVCLFIMDDTIRLLEFIAYHYTVLPLGHLVVAIDPKSANQEEIVTVLERWKPYITIDVFFNDTWMLNNNDGDANANANGLSPEEGWGQSIYSKNKDGDQGWFKNREGPVYKSQAHKRRQTYFTSFCFRHLYNYYYHKSNNNNEQQQQQDHHNNNNSPKWTLVTDPDEFLIYNYRHAGFENDTLYDSEGTHLTKQEIDEERRHHLPIREQRLPRLEQRIPIADFLAGYEKEERRLDEDNNRNNGVKHNHDRHSERRFQCLRFPGLTFSSYESSEEAVRKGVPANKNNNGKRVDTMKLLTLRNRFHGPMEGSLSKAMVNLAAAPNATWFNFDSVKNVHTPHQRMCGIGKQKQKKNGSSDGSGNGGNVEDQSESSVDYISSLFRIHHYKSGTVETHLERAGDWRGGTLWQFFADQKRGGLVAENDDIRPWLSWFIDKMGKDRAQELLFDPLQEAYNKVQREKHVAEAKHALSKFVPELAGKKSKHSTPPGSAYLKRTNRTIAACMYIQDDIIKLTEWLAYHYTVGPLDRLILGLDPSTKKANKIQELIQLWKPYMNITYYTNLSWMENLQELDGWKRRVVPRDSNKVMDWFKNKTSQEYLNQAHKRRQNSFISTCLIEHYRAGRDWVLVTDSDEYILFNYPQKDEDPHLYDTIIQEGQLTVTRHSINEQRAKYRPVRANLPPMKYQYTIADFLHSNRTEKCYRTPALNFSVHQEEVNRADLPPSAELLMTLRQRQRGRIEGLFTKTILDVSKAKDEDDLILARVDSVHNPNRRICGFNSRSGSGFDYIAAPLRLNHYSVGSIEAFCERSSDFRGGTFDRFMKVRNFQPQGENRDIEFWIDWFAQKVGVAQADELLFQPLAKANTFMRENNKEVQEGNFQLVKQNFIPPFRKI